MLFIALSGSQADDSLCRSLTSRNPTLGDTSAAFLRTNQDKPVVRLAACGVTFYPLIGHLVND